MKINALVHWKSYITFLRGSQVMDHEIIISFYICWLVAGGTPWGVKAEHAQEVLAAAHRIMWRQQLLIYVSLTACNK